MSLCGIILLILVQIVCGDGNKRVLVDLPLGQLEGYLDKTIDGREFYSFDGIPFAEPPVGERRFQAPQPTPGWSNTWVAKTITLCMTYTQESKFWTGNYDVIGDEDCLYLNIHTPTLNQSKNLDVLVFIHGGGFTYGYGAEIRPNFILDEDLVFVTVNYRLGPLGFLSTEDGTVPGNNGIRDQILALKFVQKYIKYFGGNPDSVTIDGCSAGGASVHAHLVSPQSNNLFHRGISRSGTLLNPWVFAENSLEKVKRLASLLGCSIIEGRSSSEIIACLKMKPARQVVGAVKDFQPWLYNPFSPFALVVDSYAQDPIFPDHPYILLKQGQVKNFPVIFSYVDNEGLFPGSDFYFDRYINDLNSRWTELIPLILDYNYTVSSTLLNQVSDKVRNYYLGNETVTKKNYLKFTEIISDRIFIDGIRRSIYLQTPKISSDVFLYYFTYQGAHTYYDLFIGKHDTWGAGHYEDVPYVYPVHSMNTTTTAEDRGMIKFFVKFFASFVQTGKPGLFINVTWPAIRKNLTVGDSIQALKISSPVDVQVIDLDYKNLKFWESLPILENEKLFENGTGSRNNV